MNLKVTPEDPRQLVLRTRASDVLSGMTAVTALWEDPPEGYKITDIRINIGKGSGKRCNVSVWFRNMREDAPTLYHGSPAWRELELRLELLGVRT